VPLIQLKEALLKVFQSAINAKIVPVAGTGLWCNSCHQSVALDSIADADSMDVDLTTTSSSLISMYYCHFSYATVL
jgi:pyruvate/2-oxoacid:ferredoxin oxidoreductase beta subunit